MKKTLAFLLLATLTGFTGSAQTFQVDTLQYKGDINKRINIVVLGDGYIASEQGNFVADAHNFADSLFTQAPWSHYANSFNIFAIRVVSQESGVKHPGNTMECNFQNPLVPISNPNNYFGSSFDIVGIHRLVAPNNVANVANVLAANFPSYDIAFIIANSPYYGGSGGTYAVTTVNTFGNHVALHELGHSFADLADEYYAGDFYAAEKPNMTQETNPTLVKWANWMGYNTVGIYQHCCTPVAMTWYKPHNSCKMEATTLDFCPVCQEAIVEKIHSMVDPLVSFTSFAITPSLERFRLTELIKPVPNTLNIRWKLNGVQMAADLDSVQIDLDTLAAGTHILNVTVEDTTALVRVNNHATQHISSANWVINKNSTGIRTLSEADKLSYTVFPNPTSNILNLEITSERGSELSIDIVAADGKLMHRITNAKPGNGIYKTSIPVQSWASGIYFIHLRSGSISHTRQFVKQ